MHIKLIIQIKEIPVCIISYLVHHKILDQFAANDKIFHKSVLEKTIRIAGKVLFQHFVVFQLDFVLLEAG